MSKYEPYDPTNAPIEDPRKRTRDNLDRIFKRGRHKIVEVCQSTGTGITQGEVDDYNAASKAKRQEANNVKK
jgi:hypothetical protein